MAKAKAKIVKMAPQTDQSGHDCFNGLVTLTGSGSSFVVEQVRKSQTTKAKTLKEAKAAFEAYINDTMF